MNESSLEIQTSDSHAKGLSRRDFLKLSGVSLLTLLVSRYITGRGKTPGHNEVSASSIHTAPSSIKTLEKPHIEEKFLPPEFVYSVPVYGLKEKITSENQMTRLYSYLDEQFADEHKITIDDKLEQRKQLLDPKERYLEVVIRQSAMNSFLQRKDETGVDFVKWIQMHVYAMNVCFKNAKPSVDMRTVLRRIVVIDDNLPRAFWDESASKNGTGPALDVMWKNKFNDPLDTDCCWAIADDYRPANVTMDFPYFWKCWSSGGRINFSRPDCEKIYSYPDDKKIAVNGLDGVWLDFGLIHEWSHYLSNLPDEYAFEVRVPSRRIKDFYFETGYFCEPRVSPFLSYLANHHVKFNIRDDVVEGYGNGYSFMQIPENSIKLDVVEEPNAGVQCDIYLGNTRHGGQRGFDDLPNYSSPNGSFQLDKAIATDDPHVMMLKTASRKCLYIPYAAFCMSRMAGLKDAIYRINFTKYSASNQQRTQIVNLVDESDIESFLQDKENNRETPYAKMKVDGTNAWFVWFLR
jgi:hypothetical protein